MSGVLIAIACTVGTIAIEAAKTDITVDADKTFSFAGLRSWAWHPEGAGDVRMAISAAAASATTGWLPMRVAGCQKRTPKTIGK